MRRIHFASLLAASLLVPSVCSAEDAALSTPRPVSTGIASPYLIHTARVAMAPEVASTLPADARFVMKAKLDEHGLAQDIQVVKSENPALDANVIEAVKQFRWRPATLDNQAVAMPLTLNLVVQH